MVCLVLIHRLWGIQSGKAFVGDLSFHHHIATRTVCVLDV